MNNEFHREIFDDRPAPWYVESHRTGGASVVDANHCTVLTCNGTELAAFVADAANAFATDEDVFTAADNNQDKIGVLTVQRDEARAQLAAAQKRVAELEAALRPFAAIPDSPFFCDGLHEGDMYAVVLAQYNTDFTGADLIRARAAISDSQS